jgi:hypothetical protein
VIGDEPGNTNKDPDTFKELSRRRLCGRLYGSKLRWPPELRQTLVVSILGASPSQSDELTSLPLDLVFEALLSHCISGGPDGLVVLGLVLHKRVEDDGDLVGRCSGRCFRSGLPQLRNGRAPLDRRC